MTDVINNVFNIEIELADLVLTDSIEIDIENQNIIKNIYILDNINNYLVYFFILSGVINPFTIKNCTISTRPLSVAAIKALYSSAWLSLMPNDNNNCRISKYPLLAAIVNAFSPVSLSSHQLLFNNIFCE